MGKAEIKPSLSTEDMTVYIENPKEYTKKFLELMNEFFSVVGYKLNILKNLLYFYIQQ